LYPATLWLLLRLVVTQRRLSKPLRNDIIDIASCLLPWVAMPLRFSTETIGSHFVVLGFASALGWMRFLQDSFKFSPQMGPLVLMIQKMLFENVLPFLTMFFCFFTMCFSWLWGIYAGINNMPNDKAELSFSTQEGDPNIFEVQVWDVVTLLTRFTINPDTAYRVNPVAGSRGLELLAIGVQWSWVVLSHIVLLNALIAMMNTTYSSVHDEQEGQWRLQFLEQVIFQEATPRRWFVPSFLKTSEARPHHHTRGSLTIITPQGTEVEVECWFVQIYRHGDRDMVQLGSDHQKQQQPLDDAEARSDGGGSVSGGALPAGVTDTQLEMRLKELEISVENKVNRAVTKALAGMSAKLERIVRDATLSA